MKKNYNFLLLAIVAFVISSCSSSSSDYLSVIPSDVGAVVSVNIGSLLDKSGITEQQDIMELMLEAVESESSREVSSLVGDLLDDLNNSGVDFSNPIYTIYINEFNSLPILVAKVDKKSKLLKMVEVLNGEGLCTEVQQVSAGDYNFFVLGSEQVVIAFNDKSIVASQIPSGISSYDILEYTIDPLMSQKASQSIVGDTAFKKLLSQKFDIGGFVSSQGLAYAIKQGEIDLSTLNLDDISSISAYGGFNFENGDIVAKAEIVIGDTKIANQYSKTTEFLGEIDGKHLQYIPQSALFLSAITFDGGKLAKLIEEQAKLEGVSGSEMVQELVSNINGDVTIAMMDSDKYIAYVSVKSEAEAIGMIEQKNKELGLRLKQNDEGQYNLNLGRGANFYFGVKNGAIYLSTESDNTNKKVDESMADKKYKAGVKGKNIFLYGTPNSKIVKSQFSRELRRNPELVALLEEVDYVELSMEDALSFELHVSLNNNSENSLKAITKLMVEKAGSLFR